MPQWVKAFLPAQGELTNIRKFIFMADQCMFNNEGSIQFQRKSKIILVTYVTFQIDTEVNKGTLIETWLNKVICFFTESIEYLLNY